jgi:hypothetical protein
MGKLQTKSDDKLGVKLTGTPEQGQHITLNQDAALQKVFGTQHPETADLMTHTALSSARMVSSGLHSGANQVAQTGLGGAWATTPRETPRSARAPC